MAQTQWTTKASLAVTHQRSSYQDGSKDLMTTLLHCLYDLLLKV